MQDSTIDRKLRVKTAVAEILAALNSSSQINELRLQVGKYGHALLGVRSISGLRKAISEHSVDALLASMDFECGEILAVVRSLKTDPAHRKTIIVLYSELHNEGMAWRTDTLRQAARALGADKYVTFTRFQAAELWWQLATLLPDD